MILSHSRPSSSAFGRLEYNKLIASNLQQIRADVSYVEHNINDLSGKFASRRLCQNLQNKLDNVFALISITSDYLAQWELQLDRGISFGYAKEEYDGLQNQFKSLVLRAKELAGLIKDKSSSPNLDFIDDGSTVDTAFIDSGYINDSKLSIDYDEQLVPLFRGGDLSYTGELVKTRSEGIERIKKHIVKAQNIFKNLASIVSLQEEGIKRMESDGAQILENSQDALVDVEALVAAHQKSTRRRRLLVGGAFTVSLYVIYHIVRSFTIF